MSIIPALRKQRQTDLCEFEASPVYKLSSKTAPKATEKLCLEKQNKRKQKLFSELLLGL